MAAQFIEAVKKGDRSAVDRMLDADPTLASARDEGGVSAVLLAPLRRRGPLPLAGRGLCHPRRRCGLLRRRHLDAAEPDRAAFRSNPSHRPDAADVDRPALCRSGRPAR